MFTTADLHEVSKIVNGEHSDPHHILGMHEIWNGQTEFIAVRVFFPDAESVTLIDLDEPDKTTAMERIHTAGFFEAQFSETKELFRYELEVTFLSGSKWRTRDPYSFLPQLSDMDLFLFGQGTHYEIFDKLGAHAKTVDGSDGVSFAVWAPNAKRVSVVGDFNGWNGLRSQMRALQKSGVWEIFIPGLKNGDKYKFEIISKAGSRILKSDPYGFFHELRPSTASLVCDISGHEWNDAGWIANRNKKNPLDGPVNIYEVHAGSWKSASNENGLPFLNWPQLSAELVPYVKEMNYTHIELMPVMEHPFDASWGYQVTGFFAPTNRFGLPDDFMTFVDTCHQNGIGVIMDWVPAHFPKDAHGLSRFDGTALYEPDDPLRAEHPDWGTLIFNYGRREVKNFLIASAIFWLEKYHIDGLRVDAVASMLYLDYGDSRKSWIPNAQGGRENWEAAEFLKHMNSVIHGRYPNVMMIAEESTEWEGVTRSVESNGLGFSLKWNMGWMNDFLKYMKKEPVHRQYHHSYLTFGMMYAYTERFILVLSHDEVVHMKGALVNKMPGDIWQKLANLRVGLMFMAGHPGKKLIFMGGEIAQFEEWSEAKSVNWFLLEFEHHRQMQQFNKELNKFYLTEKSLWFDEFKSGTFSWIDCDDAARSLISFYRSYTKTEGKTEYLVFVCNFTPAAYENHRIGLPAPGVYKEVFNSDAKKYGGSGVTNDKPINSEKAACDKKANSLVMRVPPLGGAVLKWMG
ncbi:MAG: 1,4-alpha-glucan branching protein GlgB [Defluviitaleaceae bacterium]|nr:1,4-alpha-glucan branching protein GlgB [Defluviitaleaceae bacterium]